MTRPIPVPLEPAKVRELALTVVQADRFPYLATIDGDQPRLRPVSPVRHRRLHRLRRQPACLPQDAGNRRQSQVRIVLSRRTPRSGAHHRRRRRRSPTAAAAGNLGRQPAPSAISRLARQPATHRLLHPSDARALHARMGARLSRSPAREVANVANRLLLAVAGCADDCAIRSEPESASEGWRQPSLGARALNRL